MGAAAMNCAALLAAVAVGVILSSPPVLEGAGMALLALAGRGVSGFESSRDAPAANGLPSSSRPVYATMALALSRKLPVLTL